MDRLARDLADLQDQLGDDFKIVAFKSLAPAQDLLGRGHNFMGHSFARHKTFGKALTR